MGDVFHLSQMCRLYDKSYQQEEALLNDGATWTYGEVYNLVKRESDRLREFLPDPGERKSILLYLPSDLRLITYFFATVSAGHVPFICGLDLKKN